MARNEESVSRLTEEHRFSEASFMRRITRSRFMHSDDIIDTSIQDELTTAQWQWKQAATSVSVTGRIEMQNMGKSQVIDIVKAKTQSAILALKDGINQKLWSSGLTSQTNVGTQVTPIATIVNNTGTVGDINGGTSTCAVAVDRPSVRLFRRAGTGGLAFRLEPNQRE